MADSFFNISKFRTALEAGAKSNLFEVNLTFPQQTNISTEVSSRARILAKSMSIPAFTVGVIEVPFRGRKIKLPGDRTYAEWSMTIVNDNTQLMRKAFDRWLAYINNPNATEDIRTTQEIDYKVPIDIAHLKINGNASRRYQLVDAFPTDVSAIDLSYETTDAIQEFTVTFQFGHLVVGDTVSVEGDAPPPTDAISGAARVTQGEARF
jgi:hypothetical protein